MPLPLDTHTMEAIAVIVDKWRKGELSTLNALTQIDKYVINRQKIQWERDHS